MKLPYKYTVDEAVLQFFAGCSKREREQLLRIFPFLSSEPFTEGEATQPDQVGRRCQVKHFGGWLIVYWPEHLAKEIHILDVERLIQRTR